MNERASFLRHRVWTVPIALAISSVVGLGSALLGDGLWDAVSWLCLGVPIAVMGWFASSRR